ncbi:RNA polymerase sigma factor [Actinomadura verrucosospora]|uniref:ECF subfamily RNA polymerase sigma-24 subunit n=1 Tax=Actinomadura verrucosospora TaxID=46165 RepID=A0A7D3W2J9_ACTVE|nr:RNA polymerase sigma factor [Actinomadura verrucosospora]QKG24551.1 ECF subfamily RNA polymerase sigma-24 subunit [Actinomadura verrucosospora]
MAAPPDVGPDVRNDGQVIERSWREPERFGEIFDAYFAEIHRYVARRLDADAADDIAAETFHVAFRRRATFEVSRDSARPWLYGIASNLIAKHRRAERRRLRALGRLGRDRAAGGHDERVAAQVSAEQVKGRLARVIGELSDEHRDVLLLVVLAGLGYEEVAQALDVPYGTVCSRFSRARKKLREALGGVDPMLDQEGPTHG